MSDSRRDLVIISIGLVVIVVVGSIGFLSFRESEKRRKHLTAEAPASIIDVYERRDKNPQTGAPGGVVNVLINYRYNIGSREYARSITVSREAGKSFRIGQPAKVCYNPENEEEAELAPVSYLCGE